MKKSLLAKLVFVSILAALLSGCIVIPGDWEHGGWHGHGGGHHHRHGGHD